MRILITGSRDWTDRALIQAVIQERMAESAVNNEEFIVIHGHCPKGADKIADQICLDLGMVVGADLIREPAQWKRYGKNAGPVRNQLMLDRYEPDEVHAFRAHGKSNGTDDMRRRAKKARVPVYTHRPAPTRAHDA